MCKNRQRCICSKTDCVIKDKYFVQLAETYDVELQQYATRFVYLYKLIILYLSSLYMVPLKSMIPKINEYLPSEIRVFGRYSEEKENYK